MELNETTNYLPYVLGRLFSVLENVQLQVNPRINTTITDRYFNSASATPAVVFPTLINLAQKHLAKMNKGQEIYFQKQISELCSRIHADFAGTHEPFGTKRVPVGILSRNAKPL